MAKSSIERLTARHRDCLELVATNHSTKEIARALSLSPNTVDGYISEAKEILGAASRRDAARILAEASAKQTPQNLGGELSRVAATRSSSSKSSGDDGGFSQVAAGSEARELQASSPALDTSFHWFRGAREHNSLTPKQRLIWIAAASIVAAFLFLASLNIIDTLARLLSN